MADLHGGSVAVKSIAGKGSRFTINLPWSEQARRPETARDGVQETPPLRALLAEDSHASADLLGGSLRAAGHEVVLAGDGLEAVDNVRKNPPDLILMDLQLPVMDGVEAIRRIREDPGQPRIPIVALSALSLPGEPEKVLQAGADLYLVEPLSPLELRDALRFRQPNAGEPVQAGSVSGSPG